MTLLDLIYIGSMVAAPIVVWLARDAIVWVFRTAAQPVPPTQAARPACSVCGGHGRVMRYSGNSEWPPRVWSEPCPACTAGVKALPAGCHRDHPFSSRTCERGTNGCTVSHGVAPSVRDDWIAGNRCRSCWHMDGRTSSKWCAMKDVAPTGICGQSSPKPEPTCGVDTPVKGPT